MATELSIFAVSEMMDIQENQTQVDSQVAAAADTVTSQLVNACNASLEEMSKVVSDQNSSSSSSSSTNNNMVEAQQVQSTWTTEFNSEQETSSSIGTTFTNETTGPDTNNMKTLGQLGNLLLEIISKVTNMLGSFY